VVVAQYLLDSLPPEAWALRSGRLVQQQVSIGLPEGEAPPCQRAELSWHDVEVEAPAFVRGYAPRIGEGGFMIPVGAIEALKRVARWAGGRLLVLVADKGEPEAGAVQAGGSPKLQRHGGGVSALVNFDALRAFWGWRPFLQSAHAEPDLGFYALAQGLAQLPTTRAVWSATLGAESLLHRLRQLDRLLAIEQPVSTLLAALEAWGFDPDVFVRMAEPLRKLGPTLSAQECEALVDAIDRTWANHFELGGALDVAFEMAAVLHRAGQLSHAVRFYRVTRLSGAVPRLAILRLVRTDRRPVFRSRAPRFERPCSPTSLASLR
jgi:hypothetical protein